MKALKKLNKKISIFAVCVCIVAAVLFIDVILETGMIHVHSIGIFHPDYEMVDITQMISGGQNLTDDDYALLYAQTGLTRTGVDRALAKGAPGRYKILRIQANYFKQYGLEKAYYVPYSCQDVLADGELTEMIYLEEGDVIISAATHISYWRMGHAALVVDAAGFVLQASTVGETTSIESAGETFLNRVNYIVLSPKKEFIDAQTKKEIAEYAEANFVGIPYDPTAGVLSDKNSIEKTQCSHLIWYAYNLFGYDVDGNGGAVVTPHDFLLSPYFEVVQVFGFDPVKLW